MKTVLIYNNLTGPMVWDTSTEKQRDHGFLSLFNVLDEQGKFQRLDVAESQLYNMARRGNAKFARALLIIREIPLIETQLQETVEIRPTIEVRIPEALAEENLPDLTSTT